MDLESVRQTLNQLKQSINVIESAVCELEQQKTEKEVIRQRQELKRQRDLYRANFMRKAMSYYAQGMSSWEVAEHIQQYFGSVWDAYDFITQKRGLDLARQRYAKAYLIKALSDAGFPTTKISKIAGITPQGCGKILKRHMA